MDPEATQHNGRRQGVKVGRRGMEGSGETRRREGVCTVLGGTGCTGWMF